ncbi:thiopeptide-type bacteriocin biosynthesis protein, partial [Klebsiella michiganensis]|uniref:thiopeptide-type bacteriocin biosynthesis protein n=1 Tax=Klebsiella michiganensis TaxID=1134687 RepID=UPI0034D41A07
MTLVEQVPGPTSALATGPEGHFEQELLLPMVRREGVPRPSLPMRPAAKGGVRSCRPGSEWLFVKLYGGTAAAEEVLTEGIGPLVRQLEASGLIDRWFFLRYADPDPHLRLRLHGQPSRLLAEAFPALERALAPMFEDGRLWKLQLDTYERELD